MTKKIVDTAKEISIHTSLAGSDDFDMCQGKELMISIHTSLAGSDGARGQKREKRKFQSTLPLREVTRIQRANKPSLLFQSTLPLREVTIFNLLTNNGAIFQSTLPLREVTKSNRKFYKEE